MSSSVSSERAFSQGGITISKRQNRLKADIVELLQCIKSMLHEDLLFREPAPSSVIELDLELLDNEIETDSEVNIVEEGMSVESGWDSLFLDDDDDLYDEDEVMGSESE